MKFRDLTTSYLREDSRILASMLAMRRVFAHDLYEVYVCVYSGLVGHPSLNDDLVTCLVVFKKEALRLMFRLWASPIQGDRKEYIAKAVSRLEIEGKTPWHLIRDAKMWCHVPFTLHDRAAFRMAGMEIPKPPKEPETPPG